MSSHVVGAAKLCPRCQHQLFDRDIVFYCIVCKYEEKKKLIVLGKEYDQFDFLSLGDAIEAIWEHLLGHYEHLGIKEVFLLQREIDRLQSLQLNLAMNKAMLSFEFLKKYGATMEAMKQILEERSGQNDGS